MRGGQQPLRFVSVAWLVALSLLGCARESRAPKASVEAPPANQEREAARYVLEASCGSCHRPDQPEAQRGALAIFDLSKPDFASGMTEEQLREAQRRLEGGDAPSDDRDAFAAFVEWELARRPVRCASLP